MKQVPALIVLLVISACADSETETPATAEPETQPVIEITANDDAAETTAGEPVVIDVLTNDIGDNLSIGSFQSTTSNGGTIEDAEDDMSLRYIPAEGFVGEDTFTYVPEHVESGSESSSATVTVTVQ